MSKVLNQWFEECIYSCITKYEKSPMEALLNDDDMQWILKYIESKQNTENNENFAYGVMNINGYRFSEGEFR